VGALEPVALLVAGAILKWIADMVADREKKSDEMDKHLASEDVKLRDKVADLDKTNSTAIATLTSGIEHVVGELAGMRSDMKEHRTVVFQRLDRNERDIGEVKALVMETNATVNAIKLNLNHDHTP
jgi:hypothetical protein